VCVSKYVYVCVCICECLCACVSHRYCGFGCLSIYLFYLSYISYISYIWYIWYILHIPASVARLPRELPICRSVLHEERVDTPVPALISHVVPPMRLVHIDLPLLSHVEKALLRVVLKDRYIVGEYD
jgi:hypothetical protein